MKILFLIYHGFSEVSGISKKIHNQVKGLKENGYDTYVCYYTFAENGHRCRYVDDNVIQAYGTGKLAGIQQRLNLNCVYDFCVNNSIDVVYSRSFQNANPWTISLFKKLKRAKIKCLMEVPTYPYDKEFVGFPFVTRLGLSIDKIFRNTLAKYLDAIVTFSDAKMIFGQKTINISNGVNLDSIPLNSSVLDISKEVHLIGVAEVHYWHGFDRLIAGLGEYYKSGKATREVYFHIVGGVWISEMYDSIHAPGFSELIKKYDIEKYVIFHGQLFGKELDDVFNKCSFAVGSLARHRSGITNIKTLKNREYASRGIPFIYSENDSDFDDQPYIVKAKPDESPIDIQSIINFIDKQRVSPADIRKTVEHLSWKIQMKKVIDSVYGK